MFVIDVATWFDDADLSWENDELYWWRAVEVDALPLHDGFARAWETLRDFASIQMRKGHATGDSYVTMPLHVFVRVLSGEAAVSGNR